MGMSLLESRKIDLHMFFRQIKPLVALNMIWGSLRNVGYGGAPVPLAGGLPRSNATKSTSFNSTLTIVLRILVRTELR